MFHVSNFGMAILFFQPLSLRPLAPAMPSVQDDYLDANVVEVVPEGPNKNLPWLWGVGHVCIYYIYIPIGSMGLVYSPTCMVGFLW